MAQRSSYSTLQIGLHWSIALLILIAWWTGDGMGRVLRDRMQSDNGMFADNTLHVWLGSAVFVLVLIRIVARLRQGAPGPVDGASAMAAAAAKWGHRLLYLLMVAVPGLGAAVWYFRIENAGELHETLGQVLMFVALAHAVVAIYHQFIKKDGTMIRMLRPSS